jgi:hypothetical protein
VSKAFWAACAGALFGFGSSLVTTSVHGRRQERILQAQNDLHLALLREQHGHQLSVQGAQFAHTDLVAQRERVRAILLPLIHAARVLAWAEQEMTLPLHGETADQRELRIQCAIADVLEGQGEPIIAGELEFEDVHVVRTYQRLHRVFTHIVTENRFVQTSRGAYVHRCYAADVQAFRTMITEITQLARRHLDLPALSDTPLLR